MVTLYSYFRSSAAWRVRICLALKGMNYDLVPIDIRDASKDSPEYCALNPQGFVPTLVTNAGALSQSLAIIDESQVSAWYRHWVQEGLAAIGQMVKVYGATYCFGVRDTLADICLVPQIYNARRFAVDLTPYPTLRAIDLYLQSLPAIAESAPEKQIDAA